MVNHFFFGGSCTSKINREMWGIICIGGDSALNANSILGVAVGDSFMALQPWDSMVSMFISWDIYYSYPCRYCSLECPQVDRFFVGWLMP